MKNTLWYNTQASEWLEGLPIGNGRIAGMLWGEQTFDRLCLNHEWLWRGKNRDKDNKSVGDQLPKIRELLKEGDFFAATSLTNTFMGGHGGISRINNRTDPYQPAGDLICEIQDVKEFSHRELNIDDAIARVERKLEKTDVTSSFIAHPKYNLIVCRWNSQSGVFSSNLSFSRVEDVDSVESCEYKQDKITYKCSFNGGISFIVDIAIKTDGNVSVSDKGLNIVDASEILAYINIGTSIGGLENEILKYPVPNDNWDELLASHKDIFAELMGRLSFNLDLPDKDSSTDKRIEGIKAGEEDPALILLYFNYGRYLLASSSICGELPANLQGKWNDSIKPAWECDYHFDINLQMNYWMTEPANMTECAEALLKYVERFVEHGKKAAKDLYGCRGVYLPLQTDAWGRATPESFGWSAWIGAAPWISQHFWWHYEYTGDKKFLQDRGYPFFKEIAEFYEDYLIKDEAGVYQIMPSQSPENRFVGTGHFPVSIGISAAMDVQLAYDSLGYAIKSAEILGVDEKQTQIWQDMRNALPEFKIGSDGRLLEWDIERVEVEPGHRHASHLYGLHPSDIFNPIDRPEQYEACKKTLSHRLAQGGGHTGWSRAWISCFYARLGDGANMWEHLYSLIKDFTTISLLDLHPPRIFQIDGNLGAVAAVLEALVQSWGGKIHLLRALPQAWNNGSISGVKTPGGHTVSMEWKDGQLVSVELKIGYSEEAVLAGLAGKFELSDKAIEVGADIVIKGKPGDIVKISL